MEELIKRYRELYDDMAGSKNPSWLDKLEASQWFNYLSKMEADEIVAKFVNQDGTRGAHWGYDTFKGAVESLGGKMTDEPFYNGCALWVTANMVYSDHAQSIAEDLGYKRPNEVPNEKMALSCYKKAVEKLKDPDRPRFVREYFGV